MEKYTKVARKENTKNIHQQPNLKQPQNVFEHNTPHSWSNVVGYGDIKITTSDNKHYLGKRHNLNHNN